MASVGAYLRDLRERRGLSIEEIARATRVGSRYLESLESDAFTALPEPVFTRGFIRAYCQALGESPDQALALFDQRNAVPAAPAAAPAAPGVPVGVSAARPPAPRAPEGESRTRGAVLVSFVLLVVLGMALFAVTLMIQPRKDVRVERRAPTVAFPADDRVPPAPAPPTVAPPTAAPGPTPAAPATAARSPSPPSATSSMATAPAPATTVDLHSVLASVSSPYHLIARTSELTWIRVRTDDGRTTEENVPPGQVREWISNRPLVLSVGNAGGVSFELNGRRLPTLGGSGGVVSRLVLPPEGQER